MLSIVDEFMCECLAIRVARKLKNTNVIDVLSDLLIVRGVPAHICSDKGWNLSLRPSRNGLVQSVPRRPASHQEVHEKGYIESFYARLRDNLLNGEIFCSLREAQIVIETWRCHYNHQCPHSSLGYKPPPLGVIYSTLAGRPATWSATALCGQITCLCGDG